MIEFLDIITQSGVQVKRRRQVESIVLINRYDWGWITVEQTQLLLPLLSLSGWDIQRVVYGKSQYIFGV